MESYETVVEDVRTAVGPETTTPTSTYAAMESYKTAVEDVRTAVGPETTTPTSTYAAMESYETAVEGVHIAVGPETTVHISTNAAMAWYVLTMADAKEHHQLMYDQFLMQDLFYTTSIIIMQYH